MSSAASPPLLVLGVVIQTAVGFQFTLPRYHAAHHVSFVREFAAGRDYLLLMGAGIESTSTRCPKVDLDIAHRLSFGCVEVLGPMRQPAVGLLGLAGFRSTLAHLGAQVAGLGQLVLLQVGCPLRPRHLRLKVPFLEMHFIHLLV